MKGFRGRRFRKSAAKKIVEFIDKAICNYQNNKEMKELRDEINSMMSQYDIFEKL